jgi:cell division protein FtsB
VLLGSLLACAYFAYHAIYGTHGLQAQYRLHARSVAVGREIVALEAVRYRLKRDVVLLAGDPPHRDIVEEHARSLFGFVRTGDLIVREQR